VLDDDLVLVQVFVAQAADQVTLRPRRPPQLPRRVDDALGQQRLEETDGPQVGAQGGGKLLEMIPVLERQNRGVGGQPVRQSVEADAGFPCGVRGPVDFLALARLAARILSETDLGGRSSGWDTSGWDMARLLLSGHARTARPVGRE
jgi:hypothetical protein